MIRTKIVATLGPATSEPAVLAGLLKAGMDVCRLNFSHGDLPAHAHMLAGVRQAARAAGEHVAILGDLAGPKIRLGKIADEGGAGGMPIEIGQTLIIQREPVEGRAGRVSTNYPWFVDDVQAGDRVLVEDGLLRFLVVEKRALELVCTCTAGGVLKSSKGVNLPTTNVRIPAITEKDWACVDWAIENDLDYLALSFVRCAADIGQLRGRLLERGSGIQIIAKIEKAEAVEDIDAILRASDGLMVARGDLGVEMDVAQVPVIQKDLLRKAQQAGKPVIVATQMLQSMIEQSSPTRAEVSDVANAIFDGADAVMLSGETSVGRFPVAVVHMMNHIAEVTEKYLRATGLAAGPGMDEDGTKLSAAIAHGLWQMVTDLKASAVVVWSQSGATARIFSRQRFTAPIVAMSDTPRTLRQVALHYGVMPVHMEAPADVRQLIERVDALVIERECAKRGDRIAIVAGSALGTPLNMTGIVIHTVGETEKQ